MGYLLLKKKLMKTDIGKGMEKGKLWIQWGICKLLQ